jgi:hypothetical protein
MAVPKALAKRLRGRSAASNSFLKAASATAGLLAAVVIDAMSEQRGRRSAALQRPGHTYRFFSAALAILRRTFLAPAARFRALAGAARSVVASLATRTPG